jgi:uncharacterized phage protein gp47/JayE
MAYTKPTLTDIKNRIITAVRVAFPTMNPNNRRSFINIISTTLATEVENIYLYILNYLVKQGNPATATDDFLEEWAENWKIERKQATKASGFVLASGNIGAIIPKNTKLERYDKAVYQTLEDIILASETEPIKLEAIDTDGDTNCNAGEILSFVSPPAGIRQDVTVDSNGLTGSADIESIQSLRNRLQQRLTYPPGAGNKYDYERWALEIAGVNKAWVYTWENYSDLELGQIRIVFTMDDVYENGIPENGDVETLQKYIDEVRPVAMKDCIVLAPIAQSIDLTIEGVNNDPEIQNAIIEELKYAIKRDRTPGGIIYLSRLSEAISKATGENHHIIKSPTADIQSNIYNEIAIIGTVKWN